METRTFIIVGWYLLIGVLCYLFIPRPPRAKEALEMAQRIHPAGLFLRSFLYRSFGLWWCLGLFGGGLEGG